MRPKLAASAPPLSFKKISLEIPGSYLTRMRSPSSSGKTRWRSIERFTCRAPNVTQRATVLRAQS